MGLLDSIITLPLSIWQTTEQNWQESENRRAQENANRLNADSVINTNESNERMQKEANATNIALNEATNRANLEQVEKTNAVNKAIADQNLQFQREQQNYEENLQKEIFNREDTAYQRTVADMNASGLNPLSMGGTNGSGAVVSRTPLQNQYQATPGLLNSANVQSAVAQAFTGRQAYAMQKHTIADAMAQNKINIAEDMANTYTAIANAKKSMSEANMTVADERFYNKYPQFDKSRVGYQNRNWNAEQELKNLERQDKKDQEAINNAMNEAKFNYEKKMGTIENVEDLLMGLMGLGLRAKGL